MKRFIILLVLLLIASLVLVTWGYAGAHLDIRIEGVVALQYEQYPQEFERILSLLANDAVRGIVYDPQLNGTKSDFVILEYTLVFRNAGLLSARMLEAQVVPVKGDVLCYSQQEARGQDVNLSIDVNPGREVRLRCYLLTRKDLHAVRDLQTSYYVWGTAYLKTVRYG